MRPLLKLIVASALCSLSASAKPVPDLKFEDLAGHPAKLSQLRGSIAVVSLWATWCAPCRNELPRLSALSTRYTPRGVRFIAISADEPKDRPKIAPYLKQQPLALDIWTGADLDTLDHLHLGNVLPATFLLDQQGEIIERIEGEAHDEDVTNALDWLLAEHTGPAPQPVIKRY